MFLICFFFDILVAIAAPIARLAGVSEQQIQEGVEIAREELGC